MVTDADLMWRALKLATRGFGHTRPNPAVGAVLVKGGKIIGEGWHKKAGGDHAEVAAIQNATRHGHLTKGATIYVTLEPCSQSGRVGACTEAIIAAGIKRVVYGAVDPNPKNRGKAKRVLARAKVVCERIANRELRASCEEAIVDFARHIQTGLPYVTVKIAMSLDGKICDNFGGARWISCEKARRATGLIRGSVDAIMVGAETIRKDNPSLLARIRPNKDLIRVIVSKSGKLPKNAQVFTDGKNPTLVFNDAKQALRELGKMGVLHVLCEGGLKLARSLADANLVDEWITVLSPKIIGSRKISQALTGKFTNEYTQLGTDLMSMVDFARN